MLFLVNVVQTLRVFRLDELINLINYAGKIFFNLLISFPETFALLDQLQSIVRCI